MSASLAVLGFLDNVDAHFAPKHPEFKAVWDWLYRLPSLSWGTWFYIIATAIVIITLFGAYKFATANYRDYEEATAYRVIPHVMRKSSQVYLSRWLTKPAIRAQIALKFENTDAGDVTLKDIQTVLYERGSWGWKGWVRELEIRGPKPERLYDKPTIPLRPFDDPSKGIPVAGTRIKSRDYPADAYFFIDPAIVFDEWITLTNGIHFLRMTIEAVAQRPYIIDIDVDWTQPGLWILSSTPVLDISKTIRCGDSPPRLATIRAWSVNLVTRPLRWWKNKRTVITERRTIES